MNTQIGTISPRLLAQCDSSQVVIIDVRTPAEYGSAHIPGSINLPLDRLDEKKVHELAESRRPYFICRSGRRGEEACKRICAGGGNAVNVEGGIAAWEKEGLELIRGKGVISLERQVRIAAGSLVVLGVLLGFEVSPWFFGLSAFVGCGLVFAGVTDTCGMAMMLSKMSWNR